MTSTATPTDVPEIIDWKLAARVGRRVAGGDDLEVRSAWQRQFSDISTVADQAVAEFTGLGGSLPPPTAVPLDRGQWVEANLATLRRLLNPVAEKVTRRRAWQEQSPVSAAMRTGTRALTGAQAGTLLGYIGQRVLGQYDLPVPGPDAGGEGTVWYVVPNIVQAERRHGFRPAHFRLWIALHETAHRRQFRGVPWPATSRGCSTSTSARSRSTTRRCGAWPAGRRASPAARSPATASSCSTSCSPRSSAGSSTACRPP